MIDNVHISGFGELTIKNLVFDFNGTIARNGELISGVIDELKFLADEFDVYVITADTFGTVKESLHDADIKLKILTESNGTNEKKEFVKSLGSNHTIAIGNGMNDLGMLEEARIGICVIGYEGAATKALLTSDIAVVHIMDAISLIKKPKAMKATLRT